MRACSSCRTDSNRLEFRVLMAGIYRCFSCDHLLKEFRSDGDLARKRATISGDEQRGQGNACCKEHQCHCAGAPVIAVNHGNGDQGAKSLKQNPQPFNRAYGNSLITMRWRLASSAVWSALIISGCAVRALSSAGFIARASCSASIRAVGKGERVARCCAISGHS